ncbi:hypothetical protein LVX13_02170 [Streptomyces albulus]|uniref:hypothetical protein n=1 Tax=Streptomyces noursei TaxID=1971 RepID=UPI001F2FF9C4|nr:hypothetical protein [Streptomyces noursei]MCE4941940.1 hypothetical protein [Streptomyces noursei]
MSILSLFYRWAIIEGYASAEPFTYRAARALFAGTGWEVRMNLTVRRTPEPTAVPLPFPVPAGIIKGEKFRTTDLLPGSGWASRPPRTGARRHDGKAQSGSRHGGGVNR